MGLLRLIFLTAQLSLSGVVPASFAATALSEKAILARCYSQMTGERLPVFSPIWARLTTKLAVEVCFELLAGTQMNAQGLVNASDHVQLRIIKQFNDFHRGWFTKKMQSPFDFGDSQGGTVDIHEATEGALFLTRALLGEGRSYRDVLRGFDRLAAVRDPASASASGSSSGFKRVSRAFLGSYDGDSFFNWNSPALVVSRVPYGEAPPYEIVNVPLVGVGTIYGIQSRGEVISIPRLMTRQNQGTSILNESGLIVPQDLRISYGGGALGSQPFLLLNFGHGFDYLSDGALKLPRAWVTEALKTFLCSEGPYLTEADSNTYLRSGENVPPFRAQTSCLRCHATLDQAALTARNLTPSTTATFTTTSARVSALIASYAVTREAQPGQEFWPSKPVDSSRFQAPVGKLYFRTLNGQLIDQNVSGIDGLGVALSSTPDYYACAARRYFEYFTGVRVHLSDSGARAQTDPLFAKEKAMREFVLALGEDLQTTGSLKVMIKKILESNYYRRSDFGVSP